MEENIITNLLRAKKYTNEHGYYKELYRNYKHLKEQYLICCFSHYSSFWTLSFTEAFCWKDRLRWLLDLQAENSQPAYYDTQHQLQPPGNLHHDHHHKAPIETRAILTRLEQAKRNKAKSHLPSGSLTAYSSDTLTNDLMRHLTNYCDPANYLQFEKTII